MSKYVEFKKFLSSLNPNGDNLILEAIQKGYNVIFEGLADDYKLLGAIDQLPQPAVKRRRGHAAHSIQFWGVKGDTWRASQKFLEYLQSFPKNKIVKVPNGKFFNWFTENDELADALTTKFDIVISRYKRDINEAKDKPEQTEQTASKEEAIPQAKKSDDMTMKAPVAGNYGNFILGGSNARISGYPVQFKGFAENTELRKLQNEFLKFHELKFAIHPFKVWVADNEDKKANVTEDFDVALNEFKKAKFRRKKSIDNSSAEEDTDRKIDIPVPEGKTLYPYQVAGIKESYKRGNVLLADDMGLGKTVQAIGVAQLAKPKSVLCIVKEGKKQDFEDEWKEWDTLGLTIGQSNVADSKKGILPNTNVVIAGWVNVRTTPDLFMSKKWDMLVMDEPHEYLGKKTKLQTTIMGEDNWVRDPSTGKYKREGYKEEPIQADRILFLTGTPTPSDLNGLWPIVRILDPDGLGRSQSYFKNRYMNDVSTGYGMKWSGAKNTEELQKKLRGGELGEKDGGIMVRRMKDDVLTELPGRSREMISVEPTGEAKTIVDQQNAKLQEMLKQGVDETRAVGASFEGGAEIRRKLGEAKIPYIVKESKKILDANPNQKLVVMVWHNDVAKSVKDQLSQYNPLLYTGKESANAKQNNKKAFQDDPSVRVIIVSMKAGGSGITLTASNVVLFGELDYSNVTMKQAEDRVHRIGQHKDVIYKYLIFDNSLDGRMLEIAFKKEAAQTASFDKDQMGEIKGVRNLKAAEEEEPKEEKKENKYQGYVYNSKTGLHVPPLTNEEKQVIKDAGNYLAAMDSDRARQVNGIGYNKMHTEWGKKFEEQSSHMDDAQLVDAYNLIYPFYRRQLEDYNERLRAVGERLASEGVKSGDM